jgi:predicted O-methyltransferase YrrM
MHDADLSNVKGFLPDHEAKQLFDWALDAAQLGPLLEIGSYCGLSTLWLASAAKQLETVVFAVDHHRGSEEHQPGEFFHDDTLLDDSGRFDSLPEFRRNLRKHEVEDVVIPVVTKASVLANYWHTSLGLVFIDGGHSLDAALSDYRGWAHHVAAGGLLVIHDVFDHVEAGGQAPRTIWQLALDSGLFEAVGACDSLRALRRLPA